MKRFYSTLAACVLVASATSCSNKTDFGKADGAPMLQFDQAPVGDVPNENPVPQPSVTPPGGDPNPQPSVTPPGGDPNPQPSVTPPGGDPNPQPSVTPPSGDDPNPQPSVTPMPTDNPSPKPSDKPKDTPTVDPSPTPSVTSTDKPKDTPSVDPSPTPSVTSTDKPTDKPKGPSSDTPTPKPSDQPKDSTGDLPDDYKCGKDKVRLCHVPLGNPAAAHEICVSREGAENGHGIDFDVPDAIGGHGGDYLGYCDQLERAQRSVEPSQVPDSKGKKK